MNGESDVEKMWLRVMTERGATLWIFPERVGGARCITGLEFYGGMALKSKQASLDFPFVEQTEENKAMFLLYHLCRNSFMQF